MSELQKSTLSENVNQKIDLAKLRNELYFLIEKHNPLITEMYERGLYVRKNEARQMTESIAQGELTKSVYEQILIATALTEGIISWGSQEIMGQIQAKSINAEFYSSGFHHNYIHSQIKRYSIFEGMKESVLDIPTHALSIFPNKTGYIDFFAHHAIFCATQNLVGHISVNDILQPLTKTYSIDESLELLISHQPATLATLFDAETFLQELQESKL
jgi:hypothetical protein